MPLDDRRTLFIAGLPDVVSEEEIQHLFCFYPKFEQCSVQIKGNKPLAFARFCDHAAALEAQTVLQGYNFTDTHTLRVELANKNLVVQDHQNRVTKRQRTEMQQPMYMPPVAMTGIPQAQPQAWNPQAMQPYQDAPPQADMSAMYAFQPQAFPAVYPTQGYPNAGASMYQHGGYGGFSAAPAAPRGGGAPTKGCNTLFVANIGEVSDLDLETRLQQYAGYVRLQRGKRQDCFVEFVDIEAATQAKDQIHGAMGMRAEFSKNPLGRRGS